MNVKFTKKLTFRITPRKEIDLRYRAESMNMSVTEFILYCIEQEEKNRGREQKEQLEAEEKNRKLHDFDRLIASLNDVNSTAYKAIESVRQLRKDIHSAFDMAFPEKKTFFKTIFGRRP